MGLFGAENEFQFTHPGGVRLGLCSEVSDVQDVSIHAPGRGATPLRLSIDTFLGVFQFTHPGGVRLFFRVVVRVHLVFQFTHPGGVRPRSAA